MTFYSRTFNEHTSFVLNNFSFMAKTASKNDPTKREGEILFEYNGQFIRPLALSSKKKSYLAAEYTESGKVVLDSSSVPFAWDTIVTLCIRKSSKK